MRRRSERYALGTERKRIWGWALSQTLAEEELRLPFLFPMQPRRKTVPLGFGVHLPCLAVGLLVRVAARGWLRQRADGGGAAARRCTARPVRLQCWCRTWAACLHRRGAERLGPSETHAAPGGGRSLCPAGCNLHDWHIGGILVLPALGEICHLSDEVVITQCDASFDQASRSTVEIDGGRQGMKPRGSPWMMQRPGIRAM
jgi:hypothetical protein